MLNTMEQENKNQVTVTLASGELLVCGKKIGSGKYADVYEAKMAGELKAVKIFNKTYKSRVRDAIHQISDLECSGILSPSLYSCDKSGTLEYLVMELVPHRSVVQWVKEQKDVIPWLPRLEMALSVARILLALDNLGQCHGNFKFGNILVQEDGEIVLSDLHQCHSSGNHSAEKDSAEEVAMMSLENFEEDYKGPTSASEVSGYVSFLSFLGSGRIPFEGCTMATMLKQLFSGKGSPFPTDETQYPLIKDAPQGYADFISQGWNADPAKRPSLETIIAKLEAWIALYQ